MTARCPKCGAINEAAENPSEGRKVCAACGADLSVRRIGIEYRIAAGAVIFFVAVGIFLFVHHSRSSRVQAAGRILFGRPIANALGPPGDIPDEQATGEVNPPDESIGRLPSVLGKRKPGDDIRPGAAGTDEPAGRVGNSAKGEVTNAPSAGGDPGNSSLRNSVELPEGRNLNLEDAGATNRSQALLLDDFSERLRQAGARSGDVQVSLEWKNINDLDLHVIDPNGEEIFYNHRTSASGGRLDVDMNVQPASSRPVENVYWPDRGAPPGTYRVEVVHYRNHGAPDPTAFTVRVVVKGNQTYYRGSINYVLSTRRSRVAVCTFVVQ